MGEICKEIVNGVEIREYCNENEGFRYLRVSDLGEFGIIEKNPRYVKVNEIPKRIKVKENDFIISRSGSLGLVSSINEKIKNSILSSHIFKVSLNLDLINDKFIEYFLRSVFGQKQFLKNNNGGIIPEINQPALKSLIIPIPPKAIQETIISIMDSAYTLKKQNESEAKNLIESIDDFVLEQLGIEIPELKEKMTFIVSSEELENNRVDAEFHQEKYKLIEESLKNGRYELRSLKEVCEYMKKGIEVGSSEYLERGKKFLRVADFDNFEIYEEKLKYISNEIFEKNKEFQPKEGEILFSKDGTIGLCKVLENYFDGIVSSGILRMKTRDNCDKYFLTYVLGNKYINLLLQNLSIGQIIKHLNVEELSNLKIPLPPLDIQEEIAEEVKQRLARAKELKQSAMENLEQAKRKVEEILLQE